MALFRALETLRPADERLFDDLIADSFLRPWARAGVSLRRFAYLSESAVHVTLRALARIAAPHSRLALTYVHRGLLDGSVTFTGGAQILGRVRAAGEPWTYGFEPAELGPYLRQRGSTLVEDLSADDYRGRYWSAAARHLSGYSFYRAAFGERAPQPCENDSECLKVARGSK